MSNTIQKVTSQKYEKETCPCCGYASLSRGDASCRVCKWEDDGHDNALAFRYSKGNQTNLNLARYRFLALNTAVSSFVRTRFFKVDESGGFIEEQNKSGRCLYRGPIPFVDYQDLGRNNVAAVPIRLKKA